MPLPMIQTAPDERLIERLFDTQPDSVVWFSPVFNETAAIIDFEVRYCNTAAAVILKAPRDVITGTRLLSTELMDKESVELIFEQSLRVWQTEQTMEFTYHSPVLDRYFNVQRSKILDGVLSITRDRTPEVKLELEKQQQAALLEKVINSSPSCIVLCQAVKNENGDVDDFKLLMVNEKIAKDLGKSRKELQALTYCQLHPAVRTNGYLAMLREVVQTGKAFKDEMYLLVFGGWFYVSAERVEDDKVIVVCIDITQTKENEKRIKEQAMLFNKVIEQSPSGISWYGSVRDEEGKIVDFKLKLANQKCAEITGFSLDELYRHPAKKLMQIRGTMHFFETCVGVVENNKPVYTEIYSELLHKWIGISLSPFEDGYLLNYLDINETKKMTVSLEQQAIFLESILNGSINGLFALEGIQNEAGKVVDLRIVKINKAFSAILGKGEEVVGKNYLSVFPAAKEAGIFDLHVKVLQTGIPTEREFYYSGEGYHHWFKISISKSGDNKLVQTFTDITETVENKLRLQRAASHLQTVIDSTQTGIFLASPVNEGGEIVDFRFKTVNSALAAFAQQKPAALINGLHGDWFPAYKKNGVFEDYKRIWESGTEERFEKQYIADGFNVWMDVSAKKLGDDLLVTFHDYTPLKNLQLQLEATIQDLKKSNERLADFAHVASHDLKEPLRKVRMNADLLEQRFAEILGDSGQQYILRIHTAIIRMQTLITDLLAYSQVSKKPETIESLQLNLIVDGVLSDLETTIQGTGARVTVGKLPQVKGDATQLRQLFQNLISNALKFTCPPRACEINIAATEVKAEDVGTGNLPYRRYHKIVISDNGIGFNTEHAEKIFKIFHRLHGQTEYEGTGIGLTIVQKVVENHHGFIKADGEPGKGATFTVYLPVQ